MKYTSEVVAPITLSKYVENIDFERAVEVSLDCPVCRRSGRTVVLFENQDESFCTPTRHSFPGHIVRIEVGHQGGGGSFSPERSVEARYFIAYDYESFVDEENPSRSVSPYPSWSRISFQILCRCGETTQQSTQPNMVRPYTVACGCGKELYNETVEIPTIVNTSEAQQ